MKVVTENKKCLSLESIVDAEKHTLLKLARKRLF